MISLFAGWRYAGRIFNAVSAREGDLRVPQPERPPSRSHPLGHGRSSALLCVLRCWLLSVCCGTQNGTLCRSGFCILRYLWWYAGPICDLVLWFFGTYGGTLGRSAIWFCDSSVLIIVRCADLVPVFFDIYGDTLGRSDPCILRYLWWYTGPI